MDQQSTFVILPPTDRSHLAFAREGVSGVCCCHVLTNCEANGVDIV